MAGLDLDQRLNKLKETIGKEVSFIEPSPDSIAESDDPSAYDPAAWQQETVITDNGPCHETAPEPEGPEAPRKFLTHHAGPRACTEDAFDCSQFKVGEPSDEHLEFCPWKVIKAYPTNFVGKRNRPHVLPLFEKIFEGRVWDFFYLHHPTKPREKPYLFVPASQFQVFLDFINKELGIALAIPGGVNSNRFFMRFGQSGTPRPRYLKRIREGQDMDFGQWPDVNVEDAKAFMAASPIVQEGWVGKLHLIKMAPVKDKTLKATERAAQKKADREHMLEETQTLLRLNEATIKGGKRGEDVVFVCVDVEAIERPPNPISEVGIAILDSSNIRNVPPGPCGRDWWHFIEAHHLRTKEYSGLVNHEFIQGCPDAFDFGTSTFPTRAKLPDAIMSILNPYIEASREIVLVGHDTQQDIQYLASLGVDVSEMPCITRVLDSQTVHQAWKDIGDGRGLASVLADLGMASKHLHNAGNDAVFTLRALIGISIEQIRQREAKETGKEYEPSLWKADAPEDTE